MDLASINIVDNALKMRRLFFVTLIVLVFAVSMLTVVRALGASNRIDPDSFAARLAGDTRFLNNVWCWQSICPGSTRRVGTNINQISVYEMTVDFHMRSFSTIVDEIVLTETNLSVGDVLISYGSPDYIVRYPWLQMITDLCYDDSMCFRVEMPTRFRRLGVYNWIGGFAPNAKVSTTFFVQKGRGIQFSVREGGTVIRAWQGFKSWHFAQK